VLLRQIEANVRLFSPLAGVEQIRFD